MTLDAFHQQTIESTDHDRPLFANRLFVRGLSIPLS